MSAEKSNLNILKPELIHLIDTQIIRCNLECPFNFLTDSVRKHDFNVGFDMAFNMEDSLVKADFSLKVTTVSDNGEEASGEFVFNYLFKIDNFNDLVTLNAKNEVKINGGLGNAIVSICYSTSRGILYTRLQGTALKSFILPVIDPNELLK